MLRIRHLGQTPTAEDDGILMGYDILQELKAVGDVRMVAIEEDLPLDGMVLNYGDNWTFLRNIFSCSLLK